MSASSGKSLWCQVAAHSRRGGKSAPAALSPGKQKLIGTMAIRRAS
jgi:hypothetical protein